ncbi:hypothetical protein V6N11_062785 [Hibiscus sabdariffa]|uniref:Protein LURP-one-related 17-like n=1 Tax=Hibiscus sabdariffa TaxID=183260 RepID=A0ABR2NP92_9ROSI
MFVFLKSLSRSAHEEEHHGERSASTEPCTSLTVWRRSLVMSCNGFTVIDCHGDVVYRVDNYSGRPKELVLMDGSGRSILQCDVARYYTTIILVFMKCTCLIFVSNKEPIFYVKKCINILHGNPNVLAYVYRCRSSQKGYAYVIEGSYSHRSCRVFDETKRVVAEIKRKDAIIGGVSFGAEVFMLIVEAGFDPGFAMALVLLLDQMFS